MDAHHQAGRKNRWTLGRRVGTNVDFPRTDTRLEETATRFTGCGFRGRQRSETFARNLSEDARRLSYGFAVDEILRRRRDAISESEARRRIICADLTVLNKTTA